MGLITTDKFLAIDELAGEKIPEKTRTRLQKMSYFYENFYREVEQRSFPPGPADSKRFSPELMQNGLHHWTRLSWPVFIFLPPPNLNCSIKCSRQKKPDSLSSKELAGKK